VATNPKEMVSEAIQRVGVGFDIAEPPGGGANIRQQQADSKKPLQFADSAYVRPFVVLGRPQPAARTYEEYTGQL
jgi:hypothetical protein